LENAAKDVNFDATEAIDVEFKYAFSRLEDLDRKHDAIYGASPSRPDCPRADVRLAFAQKRYLDRRTHLPSFPSTIRKHQSLGRRSAMLDGSPIRQ